MENTADNFCHSLKELSLEVKIASEEEKMEKNSGSEEKNDKKSRGANAGAPNCWLSRVHSLDPGVELSFFHSHSQTRVSHKQSTYKVLSLITYLYNWVVEQYTISVKQYGRMQLCYRIPELWVEMEPPLHYLPQQTLFSFLIRL